jgi:hypothetical protein
MSASNWLVSRRFDLWVFGGPAVLALGLVFLEPWLAPSGDLPFPMWVFVILFVDVAHVWSTIYRTYLDRDELRRRPRLYTLVPFVCYIVGLLAYAVSSTFFWTVLAYVAVFHFIRQQYGWVSLYNRRAGDFRNFDRHIDRLTIYASTLFPVLWWHAHLPRKFSWFMQGDFVFGLSPTVVKLLWPIYILLLVTYILRQAQRWHTERVFRSGKNLVVLTTALCWGLGIITTNTDWSFTVTNVLIHGIPYLAIIWIYGTRAHYPAGSFLRRLFDKRYWFAFILLVVGCAFVEEWAWDRLIWHEHGALFPLAPVNLRAELQMLAVPLLALPQATHYVLDAWIWRTKPTQNPQLADSMALSVPTE